MDPILGSPSIRVKSAEGLTGGDAHRRFAAWRELPDAEGACGSRAHAYVPFCAGPDPWFPVDLCERSVRSRKRVIVGSGTLVASVASLRRVSPFSTCQQLLAMHSR